MKQQNTEKLNGEYVRKALLGFVRALGWFFIIITGLGVLFTYTGRGVWWLEGAAYWIPAYWALTLTGMVICFVTRSRRWGMVGLFLLFVVTLMIEPCYTGRPESGMSPNLRILQANVYEYNKGADSFLKFATDVKADMVLLQEADARWKELLKPLETLYPRNDYAPRYPNNVLDLGQFWKGESDSPKSLADQGIPAAITKIKVNGEEVNIINVHTASPFSPKRAVQHHEQMQALSRYVEGLDGPVVLAGDLNSSFWSPEFKMFEKATKLRNARAGLGVLGTWPSFLGPLRTGIDQILVKGVDVIYCRVGPWVGSDHRPLITELYVPKRTASTQSRR
jgi:endonuclease/exonuclease/phosphatase (EEP) superfamily protein YafD